MSTTKIISIVAFALTCGLSATLHAQNIYVDTGNGYVDEFNPNGSTVVSGLPSSATGLAVSGNDIFVENYYGDNVAEYGLDGSTVNSSLITGLNIPWGIAISGNDIFVSNDGAGTVGEYTTSGMSVSPSLISGFMVPLAWPFRGATFLWRTTMRAPSANTPRAGSRSIRH